MSKAWHWFALGLLIIGGLYLAHNYQNHGGIAGVKRGLGIGGGMAA